MSKLYTLYLYTNNMTLKTYYKHLEEQSNSTAYGGKSSGIDLIIPEEQVLVPTYKSTDGNGVLIPLNIFCEMVDNETNENVAYNIYPRSSMGCRSSFRLSNSVALIDADYRGELCIILDNISSEKKTLTKHTKLVQIVLGTLSNNIKIKVLDYKEQLSLTLRNQNGFGSTGK